MYIFFIIKILNKKESKNLDPNDSDNDMEDDYANEMNNNQLLPSHHQHHHDLTLNDSKKRTSDLSQVFCQITTTFYLSKLITVSPGR